MLLLGLTGSIATGKSTVSGLLSSPPYSLPLIDADVLARRVVEPGTRAYRKIVAYFGPSTPDLLLPDPEGKHCAHGAPLNRPALGRRVFGHSAERERDRKVLNGIVHPAVRFAMLRAVTWYYLTGHWAVVLDIPLLFESRLDVFCGAVVVVAVSEPRIQMQRLRDRDKHLTEEDARNRVASQVDVRVKAERALARNGVSLDANKIQGQNGNSNGSGRGYVIYNDADKTELEHEVRNVMSQIRRRSPQWWSWLLLACPPLMAIVATSEMLRSIMARRRVESKEKSQEMAKPKL